MSNSLRNSVALTLALCLSAPGALRAQDAGSACDPSANPDCAPAAPAAEPAAEAPPETAEAPAEPTAEPPAEAAAEAPAEPAPQETQQTEAAGDGTDAAPTAEEVPPQTADGAADSGSEAAPEATGTAPAEAASETADANATSPADATADKTDAEPVAASAPDSVGGDTAEATEAPAETLPIEEPETVLSEDTGLTEEAASAEASAAEELAETAPAAAAAGSEGAAGSGAEPEAEVTTVSEETTRSSEEEFSDEKKGDDGLSPLEKLLIAGIGAAVVGELIDNNKIVQNTGDRVILQRDDGSLYVLRDDDVLLRRPGYEVATRTYTDGSTVTDITKSDGSVVRTVKDARGRVLRRTRILPSGVEVILFDDTAEFEPVVVENLPLRRSSSLDYSQADGSLEDALTADMLEDVGRRFSLSQVRNIRAVRELVPVIDLEAITFDTNSAAIRASEARKLDRLGNAMKKVTDDRPWEVFLIEGHTDAVGSAVANLTLSDRRAESLALALNEYYDIPSENLVVQGYGERYLKVPVDTDERANRRVTVRRITPLLGMDAAVNAASMATPSRTSNAAPSQLALFGDGYPGSGDPCTRSGESDFTRNFLDDSADLVACPPSVDADQFAVNLGARQVASIDGWTLFSVPRRSPPANDGMPTVGSATDVTAFQGARAGQAERGLQVLGFEAVRSQGLTTFWFNRDTGACARITTSDGRYSDVVMLPSGDC